MKRTFFRLAIPKYDHDHIIFLLNLRLNKALVRYFNNLGVKYKTNLKTLLFNQYKNVLYKVGFIS